MNVALHLHFIPSSRQYQYHRLMWDGLTSDEAAKALPVFPDTGRRWQRELREKAAQNLGAPMKRVTYIRALRCLFESASAAPGVTAAELDAVRALRRVLRPTGGGAKETMA